MNINIWQGQRGNADDRGGLNYLYHGGMLSLKEKDKRYLVINKGFYNTDAGALKGRFDVYYPKGMIKEKKFGVEADICTFSPTLGVLNGDKSVVFATWTAKRQYVRVLSNDTLSVEVLYRRVLKRLHFDTEIELKIALPNILTPVYPSVEEALQTVLSGQYLARAFNNKFFLANSTTSNNIVLGYKNKEIGEYILANNCIVMYDEHKEKEDEVSKYFRVA